MTQERHGSKPHRSHQKKKADTANKDKQFALWSAMAVPFSLLTLNIYFISAAWDCRRFFLDKRARLTAPGFAVEVLPEPSQIIDRPHFPEQTADPPPHPVERC